MQNHPIDLLKSATGKTTLFRQPRTLFFKACPHYKKGSKYRSKRCPFDKSESLYVGQMMETHVCTQQERCCSHAETASFVRLHLYHGFPFLITSLIYWQEIHTRRNSHSSAKIFRRETIVATLHKKRIFCCLTT